MVFVQVNISHWGYGATVARLTPDQKVGSSNLSALSVVNESFTSVWARAGPKRRARA